MIQNGWKNDEKLKGLLETCVKKNLTREESLDFVARDFPQHGKWSIATLYRRLRQFKIKYIEKKTSTKEVEDAVKKELDGKGERLGYRVTKQKLRIEHNTKVPRDLVYTVTQELDDEGLNRRKPIAWKSPENVTLLLKEFIGPIL